MGLTPSDLLTVTLVVTFAVAIGVAVYSRLLGWHRSRSPRLRGLLTPTLNACSCPLTLVAKSSLSVARLATRQPLLTFIADRNSASVSTQTTESSGPNGSAWCNDQLDGGSSTQAGAA